jgi:hypothetical protein
MITRQEYLDNSRGKFHAYYGQFVTDRLREAVLSRFGLTKLQQAFEEDPTFNTIPLRRWDRFPTENYIDIANFKAINMSFSLSDKVCLAKNAARQIVLNNN